MFSKSALEKIQKAGGTAEVIGSIGQRPNKRRAKSNEATMKVF